MMVDGTTICSQRALFAQVPLLYFEFGRGRGSTYNITFTVPFFTLCPLLKE